MAGGKGTRMAPFTNVLPKPLIPIGDKTILEHIMEEFSKNGISYFYFTLNYRGQMIRSYFDGSEHTYNIKYIWEKEFLGTAGSLKLLGQDSPEQFFVSNCDIIVKADYYDIWSFHNQSGSWLTIISAVQHNTIPYGVIHFEEGGKVKRIEEKPEYSYTINTGVYLLDRRCLEYIPENEVFHMNPVYTYPINEGEYIDIGQWEEYRNAMDRLNGKSI
jgi:NDP-sugar pyrophosphorylase family protein